CAGDPPDGGLSPLAVERHQRWGTGREAVAVRRQEDEKACRVLGAEPRHFKIPDCIYRRVEMPWWYPISYGWEEDEGKHDWIIQNNDQLFGPVLNEELPLVDKLAFMLGQIIPEDARIVSPLTVGGHIDHHLVRDAVGFLKGYRIWYYADFPYVILDKVDMNAQLPGFEDYEPGWLAISPQGLAAWQSAAAAYHSQLSTFWKDETELNAQLEGYWQGSQRAGCLWKSDWLEAAII
ncbi:MAG TPA: hypothetical protein VF813_06515, partial [Anaerolineaceae bacterium]